MNQTTLPNINLSRQAAISNYELCQYVKNRGFTSIYLNLDDNQVINLYELERADLIFIRLEEFSDKRRTLIKLLFLNAKKDQLIVGLIDNFDWELFNSFIEVGVNEFVYESINGKVLHTQIEPILQHLKEKQERKFKEISNGIPEKFIPQKFYLTASEVMSKSFIYSSSRSIISSNLIFTRMINGSLWFVLGKGKDNSTQAALESAKMYSWLDNSLENKVESSAVIKTLLEHSTIEFDIVKYNSQSKRMTYEGLNNLIIIRYGEIIQLESDSNCLLESEDSVFIFTNGCFQQIGMNDEVLGKDKLVGLLKTIEPHCAEGRRQRLNNFYESFRGTKLQTEDISLLGFTV